MPKNWRLDKDRFRAFQARLEAAHGLRSPTAVWLPVFGAGRSCTVLSVSGTERFHLARPPMSPACWMIREKARSTCGWPGAS